MKRPQQDVFKHLYFELKDKIQEMEDVLDRDLSDKIDLYFLQKIRKKVLINIALRGEPGSGKSVLGLELMRRVNVLLMKIFNKKINFYQMIASDDNEMLRMAKNEKIYRTVCIEVDEYNPMMRTGANATTEIAEEEFFSNLCRVYYMHRIKCSPNRITDPNVEVIFDVMDKDEEKQETHVKIQIRNKLEGLTVDIGSAWIDVSETLKADWYRQYEIKKKMRVDLLTEHGIRDIRELEFAEVQLDVLKQMQTMVYEIKKSDLNGIIRLKVSNIVRNKYKRPLSWFAEDEIIKPIRIILEAQKNIAEINSENTRNIMKTEVEEAMKEIITKVEIYRKYKEIE